MANSIVEFTKKRYGIEQNGCRKKAENSQNEEE
jgi:hypothetical protein